MNDPRTAGFVVPLHVTIGRAERRDLRHLEWFGALTDQRPAIESAFASQKRGDGVMLLARVNDLPIGQVWIDYARKRQERVGIVWAVRVLPPLRGLGIGSMLMTWAESDARARSVESLELLVEFENQAARALYTRLGYEVTGVDTLEYEYITPAGLTLRGQVAGWSMRKHLAPGAGRSAEPPEETRDRLATEPAVEGEGS